MYTVLDEYHAMMFAQKVAVVQPPLPWSTTKILASFTYNLPLVFVPACQTANRVDTPRHIVKQN